MATPINDLPPGFEIETEQSDLPPGFEIEQQPVQKTSRERAMNVLTSPFRQMAKTGPASFNTITGGPQTEMMHGLKTSIFEEGAMMPNLAAEALSGATDPQNLLMAAPIKSSISAVPSNVGKLLRSVLKTRKSPSEVFGRREADIIGQFGRKSKQITSEFESKSSGLKGNINKASYEDLMEMRPRLAESIGKHGETYGEKIAQRATEFRDKGGQITNKQYYEEVILPTLREADDELISGVGKEKLLQLAEKYKPKPSKTDLLGREVSEEFPIDIERILADKKAMKRTISAPARSGSRQFSEEDIVAPIFTSKLGAFLENQGLDLKDINKSYAPIIQMHKEAIRKYKPYKGEFDTSSGIGNILKRALGNDEEAKILAERISSGSTEYPGIGEFGEKTKGITQEIAGLESSKESALKSVASQKGITLQNLARRRRTVEAKRDKYVVGKRAAKVTGATALLGGAGEWFRRKLRGR